jgi:hypothetical protein
MSILIDEDFVRQNIASDGIFEGNQEPAKSGIAYAQEPKNRSLALDGYLWWNNLSVSYEGGTRLFVSENTPLRANQVEFYIDDLSWQYAVNGPRINDPWGNGQQAPGDWFVPGMLQFGVIIFQARWWGRVDRGINRKAIQQPGEDVLFNINDKRGTYGDNGGSFDLYLKVLS